MITAWIGSFSFLCVMILYILLVLGLPFGEFVMGGMHKVLPTKYRIACAVSVIIQLFAIIVLMQIGNIFFFGLPQNVAKGIAYFYGFYLCINTLLNGLSRSRKERIIMTPLSAITAFCFFYTILNS